MEKYTELLIKDISESENKTKEKNYTYYEDEGPTFKNSGC